MEAMRRAMSESDASRWSTLRFLASPPVDPCLVFSSSPGLRLGTRISSRLTRERRRSGCLGATPVVSQMATPASPTIGSCR